MKPASFKILICSPKKSLFHALQKGFLYQNVELFYLPHSSEIEQFVHRVSPCLIVTHLDTEKSGFKKIFQSLEKIGDMTDIWHILLAQEGLHISKIISNLPDIRFFIFKYEGNFDKIAQNIQSIKDVYLELKRSEESRKLEEDFNYSLKIIHQEHQIQKLFDRLVNFLPKVIEMDYWAIFNLDSELHFVQNFSQFIPPTRRNTTVLTPNLEKIAESWLKRGRAFSLSFKEDKALFGKLNEWGWPIKKLYFMPAIVKDKAVGGLILGSIKNNNLEAREIRLLNDISKLVAERIFEIHLTDRTSPAQDDFANQLIVNRFSEDSIFYLSCKKFNQITHGSSTVFWQYNKGFGFIFPKYFYFKEGDGSWHSLEKNVVFMNKEKYFHQLLSTEDVKTIDRVTEDARLDESTRKTFRQLNYNNLLIIPLRLHKEITGAFVVNKSDPADKFNLWEAHNVENIIQQIQKVLEDASVVKEAQLKLKQLSKIFELGNEIKLDIQLEEILKKVAMNLRKTLGWNDVAVLLVDEFGKEIRPANIVGFSESLKLDVELRKIISLREFEKLLSNCQKIGDAYFFDSQPIKRAAEQGELFADQITSWHEKDLLIVPMETRNKNLGYLILHDPVDRLKPTLDKVIPLEYYANQAAIAVENFQLYERLSASEERYRSLAETMSLGLVTCNQGAEVLYINPAFEKLVGLEKKHIISRKLHTFFDNESRLKLDEIALRLNDEKSDEKTRIENVEANLISAAGSSIPVSLFAFPFFQQKKKVGFFMVVNDLRVLKRLERMKADFNSMIVHDLRSPMNVIQGFIELIRNRVVGEVNEEQEELLDIAKENVKKVLTLIDNFLVASKIEVGKFSIEPKLNEINSLIERVVENHKILLKNKNIKIKTALDSNLPLLFFDSLRIEQVLNNLLSNAMKFTPENGKIVLESSLLKKKIKGEEKYFASISVKDTGVGIPKDKLDKIFDLYEQVEDNGKLNARGTGLGLSICREIVHLHGGQVWAESEPGKGSTFFFTLPIEPTIEKIIK